MKACIVELGKNEMKNYSGQFFYCKQKRRNSNRKVKNKYLNSDDTALLLLLQNALFMKSIDTLWCQLQIRATINKVVKESLVLTNVYY